MWQKLKKRIWRWRGVFLAASGVTALVIATSSAGLLQLLEWAALDQFFRLRPREPVDSRIVIVSIDESDLNRLGQWPIPDGILAQLLETLKAQNPRVIGLDLYRNLTVQPGHQALVKVFQSTPNLIGVEKVVGETVAPPPVLSKLGQVGIADLVLDADGKIRRGLLTVKPDDGQIRESLALKLALMYLEAESVTPRMIDAKKKHLGLGKAVFVPFTGNDGGYARTNSGGYQILLNFRGRRERFQTLSLTQVLENRIPPGLMRDRIVLIGATGQSLNDFFYTPYSSTFLGSPERMAGVVVHANLISQIVSAALDGRPLIKTWTDTAEWFWIGSLSFVGATLHWLLLQADSRFKNLPPTGVLLTISMLSAGGILVTGSYFAFLGGWWIPVVSPLLGLVGSAVAIGFYQSLELQREKADLEILLETATEHYDSVAAELQHKAEEAARESERKLAQFLEAIPVGVAVVDASGKLYFFNERAKEILDKGVVPKASVGELPELYQAYLAGTEQLYPTENLPIMQALRGNHITVDDMEIHRPDKIIPLEVWGTPIYDDQGNIAYAIAVFQDITERKRAEEALRQAEQKYRRIFENALEGIFQTTYDGHYISANPALAQLYGYNSPEELIATLTDIEHQLYVDPYRRSEFVSLMQQQGAVSRFESQVYRKDGSIIWISENARTVFDANKTLLYYQGFVEDITERKQAEVERAQFTEELFQLNQAFSRFVPRQFLQLLNKKSLLDVQLGDQVQQEMSVLFSDIRNFTALSETMTPQENFNFINAYLSRMEPAIIENQGFIDKYIGDAIMALFSGEADDAVKAGIAMLQRLAEYNQQRVERGYIPIQIGIGINTGSLMLGTVGGKQRMDSTVISDAVNLASRLQGLTKEYGVPLLISHHTFGCLRSPDYCLRFIARVKVKGKLERVSVFEVFDADPPEILRGKLATKSIFEQALWLYSKQSYQEAAQRLQDCLDLNPADKVAQIYLERCRQKERE